MNALVKDARSLPIFRSDASRRVVRLVSRAPKQRGFDPHYTADRAGGLSPYVSIRPVSEHDHENTVAWDRHDSP